MIYTRYQLPRIAKPSFGTSSTCHAALTKCPPATYYRVPRSPNLARTPTSHPVESKLRVRLCTCPGTLVFTVPVEARFHLHLVSARDKPRNHSLTEHGIIWAEWPRAGNTRVASEPAITASTVHTFEFAPVALRRLRLPQRGPEVGSTTGTMEYFSASG